MTQHTKGPWKLETQRAPNGGTYYRIYDHEDANAVISQVIGDGRIEYHANAALIAAAPELKDLLFHALHYIETPGDFTERERLELCQDIDNIIAKAEGRG